MVTVCVKKGCFIIFRNIEQRAPSLIQQHSTSRRHLKTPPLLHFLQQHPQMANSSTLQKAAVVAHAHFTAEKGTLWQPAKPIVLGAILHSMTKSRVHSHDNTHDWCVAKGCHKNHQWVPHMKHQNRGTKYDVLGQLIY